VPGVRGPRKHARTIGSRHTGLLAIDDASYVLSKIEIATWGPTLNKHHCAVLAAPGVNGILAARIATGLFRESNLHIPNDQYLNE